MHDGKNILYGLFYAHSVAMEQTKRAKEITRQLEDMLISYKQSCPYTSSWKSEEALIEISSFKSRLDVIKEEVVENEVQRYRKRVSFLFPCNTHHFYNMAHFLNFFIF